MDVLLGMLAAVASMLFFGSYAVPLKLPAALPLHPVVFQLYKSMTCFVTSWLVLLYTPYKFTWWGMVGALIWVANGVIAICAVRWAGIGISQCLWSGLSLFISYVWGAYIFKETLSSHGLSILALLVMALGMTGVGLAVLETRSFSLLVNKILGQNSTNPEFSKISCNDAHEVLSPLSKKDSVGDETKIQEHNVENLWKGIFCAAFVGILNGSFMVPLKYANKDVVGVEYLVSFGIGAMTMSTLLIGVYFAVILFQKKPRPPLYIPEATMPAILAGILWSLGNFFSIYATLYLGVSLGWPLVQCQLLVSAMWAVFFYREVTTTAQSALLIFSSAVVVLGAILLSRFGCIG